MLKFAALYIFVTAALVIAALAGLSGSYLLPLSHDAIQYDKVVAHDRITELQRKLDNGTAKLPYEPKFGYLRSVLKALNIRESSQVLVFSKTSFQAPRIGPDRPRAIYYNDQVAVGFVLEGDVLEIAALDPRQGTIFYTLDQASSNQPEFGRSDSCLQCHQTGATFGVPGLVVRSVFPDESGMPLFQAGTFTTDHRSPLKTRWGGWYVTGSTGSQTHMGNAMVPDPSLPDRLGTDGTQNLSDLRKFIGTNRYLTPDNDVVALMTLEHQTQMVNLITRVGWETRMAMYENDAINRSLHRPETEVSESVNRRIDNAAAELLEYMLFGSEQRLSNPIRGSSSFAEEFSRQGPRDAKGRSLREFDLHARMFRYPCSYMIYSDAFQALPEIAKERIYRQLFEILAGKNESPHYAGLSPSDRLGILEILRDTKQDLPAYWNK